MEGSAPASHIVALNLSVNMCLVKYHVLIICLLVLECYTLNCRSDGGPKEAELKNIYKKCLKMQENKNSSRGHDQLWKESRGQSQRSDGRSDRNRNDNSEGKNERRERIGSGMRDRDDMNGWNDDRRRSNDRMDSSDRMATSDRLGSSDRMGNGDRMGGNGDRGRRNGMNGRNEKHDMQGGREQHGRGDYLNGREDFGQNENMGSQGMYNNNYYSSTPMPRRYKRDKRPENSGQRSQYNPNMQKISGYNEDNFRSEEKNSSENNSSHDGDNKACALHCFLQNLEMTGEDGMPDRYLVTHAITKDVKNDDLRDFLQESIEECFQILDNENTEDKCEFSKNLLMCLSEKGRANCDDWKDDLKF